MVSKISSAFARLLKPISRGASAGDLTQKEGSNAGFTAWGRPKPGEQGGQQEKSKPDEGTRPGLKLVKSEPSLPSSDDIQDPPLAALSDEEKTRLAQNEGKKNYFGEQKARSGVKIAKGSLYDKKAA